MPDGYDPRQPQGTSTVGPLVLGMSARARLLFVVYMEMEADDVVRIISARKATTHERQAYEVE
jgi:uncharacterized DUF497 family protein